jgi:hypothetical protein
MAAESVTVWLDVIAAVSVTVKALESDADTVPAEDAVSVIVRAVESVAVSWAVTSTDSVSDSAPVSEPDLLILARTGIAIT